MFSLDLLLVAYGKVAWTFIVANKFTILAGFYTLERLAKTTKTTVDDNILTFIKNLALTCIGKGAQVQAVYEQMKDQGLIHEKLDGKTLKHLTKKFGVPKVYTGLPDVNTDTQMPVTKQPRLDEIDDGPTVTKPIQRELKVDRPIPTKTPRKP